MPDVDGELNLRLWAERDLLDRTDRHAFSSPLLERARALVAVGALEPGAAQRIVDNYGRALALRGHQSPLLRRRRPPGGVRAGSSLARPSVRRIAFVDHTIDLSWGQAYLRWVSFADDGVRIAVTMRPAEPPLPGIAPIRPGPRSRSWPPSPTVTDDHGTTVGPLGFSGGGSDDEWGGTYGGPQPLAPDTAWIDFDGARVELQDAPRGADVALRRVEGGPVERYLRHRLELRDHHDHGGAAAAVDALVDCGALAADAPLGEWTRIVADSLAPHAGPAQAGANPVAPGLVPEPWRSLLLRRAFVGGPYGTVRIGAITPEFGGITATVYELISRADGFAVDLAMTGDLGTPGPVNSDVSRYAPTYTASDDRGNFYLGTLGDWNGNSTHLEGTLTFCPGLDPRADALGIAITAGREQAVIRTPLRWTEPP